MLLFYDLFIAALAGLTIKHMGAPGWAAFSLWVVALLLGRIDSVLRERL